MDRIAKINAAHEMVIVCMYEAVKAFNAGGAPDALDDLERIGGDIEFDDFQAHRADAA